MAALSDCSESLTVFMKRMGHFHKAFKPLLPDLLKLDNTNSVIIQSIFEEKDKKAGLQINLVMCLFLGYNMQTA